MDLPRLDAFARSWQAAPMMAAMVAAFLGHKSKHKPTGANADPPAGMPENDPAQVMAMFEALPRTTLPKILTPEEYKERMRQQS